jgi:biopolymer transport protein ExbB
LLLLVLSIVAVTLIFERIWFWITTNRPRRLAAVVGLARALRRGEVAKLRTIIEGDQGVYAAMVRTIIDEGASEAAVAQAIETQQSRLQRFMPALSTIITAAPMLGILGTVLGLIKALQIFSTDQRVTDPSIVSPAIGESLITTAAGLTVAIVVLFPYNWYRAQVDRTLGRLETLAAAADEGRAAQADQAKTSPGDPKRPYNDAKLAEQVAENSKV